MSASALRAGLGVAGVSHGPWPYRQAKKASEETARIGLTFS